MADTYVANERVRHSINRRYYEIGETVPLDHLNSAQIEALIARGAIRRASGGAEIVGPVEPEPVRAKATKSVKGEDNE